MGGGINVVGINCELDDVAHDVLAYNDLSSGQAIPCSVKVYVEIVHKEESLSLIHIKSPNSSIFKYLNRNKNTKRIPENMEFAERPQG
jgi:hypothetical protein